MTWRTDAEAHALREAPREACGVVVVINGRERYRPCRNMATDPGAEFVLDPAERMAAEDAGELAAVVHSHPGATSDPSEADLLGSAADCVPWHIVGLPALDWRELSPPAWRSPGWRAPLVGREFEYGRTDCYTLIRDWYRQERGIVLPDFPRRDGDFQAGRSLYEDGFELAGFRESLKPPEPGDILLMKLAAPVPDHGAVYLGGDTILHHLQGRLSSRDAWGGFLRSRTVKVLRHVSTL
jgi:proteasome lid subunit RPN8/RPN11